MPLNLYSSADVIEQACGRISQDEELRTTREKRMNIEGPIRIPSNSLLFFFNALAFPAISSKSLKFQSELFSTPTRFRHICLASKGLRGRRVGASGEYAVSGGRLRTKWDRKQYGLLTENEAVFLCKARKRFTGPSIEPLGGSSVGASQSLTE